MIYEKQPGASWRKMRKVPPVNFERDQSSIGLVGLHPARVNPRLVLFNADLIASVLACNGIANCAVGPVFPIRWDHLPINSLTRHSLCRFRREPHALLTPG